MKAKAQREVRRRKGDSMGQEKSNVTIDKNASTSPSYALSYDILRLVAFFCCVVALVLAWGGDTFPASIASVAGDRSSAASLISAYILYTVADNLAAAYQPLFLMLAGTLAFTSYGEDIPAYLKNRFLHVGIPFAIASLLCLVKQIGFSISLGFAKDFITRFLTGSICDTFDFLYIFIVFYLMVPFLAKMAKALSPALCRGLFLILLLYFALFDLCVITDTKLALETFPFFSLFGYAMVGWLLEHMRLKKKEQRLLLALGTASLVISSVESIFYADKNWALTTYAPTRLLLCAGVYVLCMMLGRKLPSCQERDELACANFDGLRQTKDESMGADQMAYRISPRWLHILSRLCYPVILILILVTC